MIKGGVWLSQGFKSGESLKDGPELKCCSVGCSHAGEGRFDGPRRPKSLRKTKVLTATKLELQQASYLSTTQQSVHADAESVSSWNRNSSMPDFSEMQSSQSSEPG